MKRLAIVVIALCALTPPARAQTYHNVLPPLEYDHPYKGGELIMIIATSTDKVRELCPDAPFKSGWPLGCSRRMSDGCRVVLAREDIIERYGWTLDIIRRHEIAHCNGWVGHDGARPALRKAVKDDPRSRPTP